MELRQYATAELERMTPAQLLEFSFYWNNLLGDGADLTEAQLNTVAHCVNSASQEMESRWGADTDDNLAEYFTASHASYEDMGRMARESADLLVEIAKGEHDCGSRERHFRYLDKSEDDEGRAYHRYLCQCGRIWGRPVGGNTYFDPTNTTVEDVLSSADRN